MARKPTDCVVGVDLGGTKILAAVIDKDGKVLAEHKRKTVPRQAPENIEPGFVIERIVSTVRNAIANAKLKERDIVAVGVGAPGPVDPTTGRITAAVNIPGWHEPLELGAQLSEALRMPVFVDNDVNVGTLGEATYGAGQGFNDVIGIFVGTGIGGGLILDGKLRRGFRYAAGEIGHMIINSSLPDGRIEALASRSAISRQLQAALDAGEPSMLRELAQGGITSSVINAAFAANDPLTTRVIAEAQQMMALFVASLVNCLDPERVILGGGLVESLGEAYVEPIRQQAVSHYLMQEGAERIGIVSAALGDHAGVIGAAVLARQGLAARK